MNTNKNVKNVETIRDQLNISLKNKMEQQTSFIMQDFFYFSTNIYVEIETF